MVVKQQIYELEGFVVDKLCKMWVDSNIEFFTEFIKKSDLGIRIIIDDGASVITNKYYLIDEYKWVIAKLKFGL